MLKNYLLTAYRCLARTKILSLVNILGLALGMTACLLILDYANYEKSYDRFHDNADRIYRLRYERADESGSSARFASCCPPAAARIRDNYPEVEQIGRLLKTQAIVSYQNTKFLEERIFYAEPEFLDILRFSFIEGDPLTGLREPTNAYISQTTAIKYFGDQNPIGQTLTTDGKNDYIIAGIFEDIPHNSHIKFDILLPWEKLAILAGPDYTEAWGHTGSYTYLRVSPGTDPREFERNLQPLIESECPWLKDYKMTMTLPMQPLTDIHLTSHFMQEYEANGDLGSVNTLYIVAFFIMTMAWVNFVNLGTARSINRAREVGLRKVVGASLKQLRAQFFIEIGLTNLMAAVGAIGLVALSLPYFYQIAGIPAGHVIWLQPWFWIAIGLMLLAGVFLSGLYPIIAMSSFEPITALRGRLQHSARGVNLRKVLVIFQFAVGVVLVIATLSVFGQISFMRNQALGFAMDQTLVVRAPRVRSESYGPQFDAFKQSLLQNVEIDKISHVTEVPGKQIYWDAGGIFKAGGDVNDSKNYQIVGVDYDFAEVFELNFAAGRNFSREFATDTGALILNETAAQFMGFEDAESAVGDQVNYWGQLYPVIGVLKDYHQQSPKVAYEPHIYRYAPHGRGTMGMIAIKLNSPDIRQTLQTIQRYYDEFFPDNSFNYFFLNEYYNQQYESDEVLGQVYGLFSFLAIAIIALGIYGLTAFSVAQLTREIGIRKVLGASVANIMRLLTKEFAILIVVANVFAWPVAYYAVNRWLEGFALRTDISITIFLLAGISVLLVALLTVSYQVIKAARANPVEAIQHE